jgi:hypothetical protein
MFNLFWFYDLSWIKFLKNWLYNQVNIKIIVLIFIALKLYKN